LTFAWLVGGLIEAVTKRPYEELCEDLLSTTVMGMEGNKQKLFLAGISEEVENDKDLAVLSIDRSGNSEQTKRPETLLKRRKKQMLPLEKRMRSRKNSERKRKSHLPSFADCNS